MAKIIKAVFPNKSNSTFVVRKNAAVHVDWTPVVRFEAATDHTTILWNNAGLEAAGIERQPLLEKFNMDDNSSFSSAVEWSL